MKKQKNICLSIVVALVLSLTACVDRRIDDVEAPGFAVANQATKVENEVFLLNILEQTPYSKNIESEILKYFVWLEKASGLDFYPTGKEKEKVIIDCDGGWAWGGEQGINIEKSDYLLSLPDTEFVYFHELSHTLQLRLVSIDCPPFIEGFAILNSLKVAKENNRAYIYWHLLHNNYCTYDLEQEKQIISANFEEYYRTLDYSWEAYLYGFRFGFYLQEKYGDDILPRIIKAFAIFKQGNDSSQNEFIDFLIEQTDKTVFTDFVNWYWQNTELFACQEPVAITDKQVFLMPLINDGYQGFSGSFNYLLAKDITIDFSDAHQLAAFYGYKVQGIVADVFFAKKVTIKAYDEKNNLIATLNVAGEKGKLIEFPGAVKLLISGYQGEFMFNPDFDACYSK